MSNLPWNIEKGHLCRVDTRRVLQETTSPFLHTSSDGQSLVSRTSDPPNLDHPLQSRRDTAKKRRWINYHRSLLFNRPHSTAPRSDLPTRSLVCRLWQRQSQMEVLSTVKLRKKTSWNGSTTPPRRMGGSPPRSSS